MNSFTAPPRSRSDTLSSMNSPAAGLLGAPKKVSPPLIWRTQIGSFPWASASRYICALSGIVWASPRLVTPWDRWRRALCWTRSPTASSPYTSMNERIVVRCTISIARSWRNPVGSPDSSRTITPPAGSGVSRSMPAKARAAEFAYRAW